MLFAEEWAAVRSHALHDDLPYRDHWNRLYSLVMEECILHPMVWTYRLAEQLLENGDEAFRVLWERFYVSSRGTGNVEDETDDKPSELQPVSHRKRPLADVNVNEDSRIEVENISDPRPRKVWKIQTTGWAQTAIGELPPRRIIHDLIADDD
jgi:hypothetical protein